MNGCERYEFLASLAVDEETTLEEQAELERHLERCPGCRAYFEDIKRLHEALTPEKIVLPEDFHTRVMDQVRQTAQDRPEIEKSKKAVSFPHWRQWAALAACCAIVALSVWGVRSAGGSKDEAAPADNAPRMASVQSMPQESSVQNEAADAVEDEIAALSEAAPPPLPEEYEDMAKSAAKEGLGEGRYQPLVEDTAEPEAGGMASYEAAPPMPEPALTGGGEDASAYEDGPEAADGPADVDMTAALSPADAAVSVDRTEDPEASMPAPETEAEDGELEKPDEAPDVGPVEVINAPEEGVLIAFSGGAAQAWVENTLGLEWAGGGSYTLSVEQYGSLLEVLLESGEPYSIEPGNGYCLMTE